MKKNQINTSLIIGAFLVIIFGFMLFTFQVREGEVAIKTRFGKAVLYDDLYVEGDTLPDGKAVGDVKRYVEGDTLPRLTLAPRFALTPALACARCTHIRQTNPEL